MSTSTTTTQSPPGESEEDKKKREAREAEERKIAEEKKKEEKKRLEEAKKKEKDFDPEKTEGTELERRDLDSQTRSNYRNNARKVFRILTRSDHPSVKDFKEKLLAKYPNTSIDTIAKNFGLAIALLNNCKHGVLANDPDLVILVNPDNVVNSLRKWKSLSEPILLEIVRAFEEITGGKNE